MNQTSKHTPGPWQWEGHPDHPDHIIALSAGKDDVLICSGDDKSSYGLIRPADADLIEAAPDLLNALEETLPLMKEFFDYLDSEHNRFVKSKAYMAMKDRIARAEAAILKAKREA